MDTSQAGYTERLRELSGARWKRWLNVQAPYQRHLRKYDLGVTLDVGCGIGRNLPTLAPGSRGVDHNADSVQFAQARGLAACTVRDFEKERTYHLGRYDSILFAHVLEHMRRKDAVSIVWRYLPNLKPGGRVLFICPQMRGYKSDRTHVTYLSGDDLVEVAREAGLVPGRPTSFPFPAAAGRVFTYNETHLLSTGQRG
jgi:2-polyprenyl-3-methyl-5-hydroxy-6-metoxy-1,4-benzoquinol methylase